MASRARTMVLPTESAAEAALAKGVTVYGANSLSAVIAHLNGSARLKATPCGMDALLAGAANEIAEATLGAVRGQEAALRGLELAMAGGHNMLLVGPPGAGKTMIAKSAPALIPPLTAAEQIQVSRIHSVRKKSSVQHKFGRPFRAVHHSTTQTTLLGGGADPRPGEISLAHGGVLFLDELGEWDRHVLNALRDPLESGRITISRAQVSVDFPCEFQLIAATNPCPCGYLGHVSRRCDCSEHRITAYRRRFSGPLLDRIDIQLDIHPVNLRALGPRMFTGDKVEVRKARVMRARAIQSKRNPGGRTNSRLNPAEVLRIVKISNALRLFLIETMNSYHLSARSHDRVLKMARTLADLDGRKNVNKRDLAEALQYRRAGQ
jgi:magnesium chelatase family protein